MKTRFSEESGFGKPRPAAPRQSGGSSRFRRTNGIARSGTVFYAGNVLSETKEERDSAQPDFWSERYANGRTPWQLDHVPQRLSAFIEVLPPACKVLIPGCGDDHRTIEAFRHVGHEVIAIDFSPVAIERTKRVLPDLGERIILADFFSHNFGDRRFDVIYERTFLCSLPPRFWKNYASRVAELLRPHGTLAGFFFYGQESEPPPYPLTDSGAVELFCGRFDLTKSESVTDSLSIFAGKEKWEEWQCR